MRLPSSASRDRRHLRALSVAAMVSTALVCLASRTSFDAPAVAASASTDLRHDPLAASWCAEGVSELPSGGCLAMPEEIHSVAPLILYLHGLYEADRPEKELGRQARLAARATRRGYAVLALRSSRGACHPAPEASTEYCWPSNERVADRAHEVVESWSEPLAEAERLVGPGPRYVVGFSSGGFFASLLAVRSLFHADAFVVAHAGPVEPVLAATEEPPLLLLSAHDDPSQDGMRQLDQELTAAEWPHEYVTRDGGHELTDGDVDQVLAFLARVEGTALAP